MKKLFTLFLFSATNFCFAQVVCNLTYEQTIQNFDVYLQNPTGNTMYRAKMYIDADGSPRAYGPNNSGLDWTANAGYTGNWWGVVADASGQNPILQTASDPYPGMYVSTTSLVNSNYAVSNPLRYCNSETVPFFVLPSSVVSNGSIHIGDVGYVYNTTTGQSCFAIYADAGPAASLGEGSIYLASQIGVDPDARTGGTSAAIIDYIVFPNSGYGQGTIPSIAQIDSIGNIKLNTAGGSCIVSCIGPVFDHTIPTTVISTPQLWDTAGFNISFTDADNSCGSGVDKSFYQVSDFNGTEWRANNTRGFFADDFDLAAINSDWTTMTGTWGINSGALDQNDQSLSNTNIYAPLTENLSNEYLYNWSGKISGTGNNRRAGFHFFCDNPTLTNRGNNYFVWFRVDQSVCEFYKVTNDVFSLVSSVPMTVNASQWYDWKVIYDRITGKIEVYQDNIFIGSYTDSSPISTGNYISFRSGNCDWQIDNFRVYRSRAVSASALVNIGACASCDMRYENQNPSSPAGKVRSVVVDAAKNVSAVQSQNYNIDLSHPSIINVVNDGTAIDIDTTFNGTQLQANWTNSTDVNSGIANYYFAIGTTPGAADVVAWTNNGNSTSVTATALTLVNLQHYYVSVTSVDAAGMRSNVTASDGQMYLAVATNILMENSQAKILIYPNPSGGIFTINTSFTTGEISVCNSTGEIIFKSTINNEKSTIDLSSQPDGIYFVTLKNGERTYSQKIIVQK
ncbi:MAG: T9SS type A sorting domain-containing protein [Bacteroidetes bacterium]|nr:T9SS type A sorting domain-containing protein [Bacteroidota bacterium]